MLDQAGWHGARALVVPPNLTLVPLPPYSPELNPVERPWLDLRERYLPHRLLEDYKGRRRRLLRRLDRPDPEARTHPAPHQILPAAMRQIMSGVV